MPLRDLNILAAEARDKCLGYDNQEIILPQRFKDNFSALLSEKSSDRISYKKYTAIVKTAKNLTITFPNQWFFIGAFFSKFVKNLVEYKGHYNEICKAVPELKEQKLVAAIKESKTIPENIRYAINNHFISADENTNFKKFLSDYSWWYGSKTIDRSDYYVSPVLSLAKVVNVSQSYIGDLAYFLSQKPELSEFLQDCLEKTTIKEENYLTDTTVKNFVYKVFKFLVKKNRIYDLIQYEALSISKYRSIKYKDLSLTSIFWTFVGKANESDLTHGQKDDNKLRAFPEILLNHNGRYYYLSGEWTDTGSGRLDFQTFKEIFNEIYHDEFLIRKNKSNYELIVLPFRAKPLNQILYGPPGTGKTYNAINHALAIINNKDVKDYKSEQKENPDLRKDHKGEFDSHVSDGRIQLITFHQSYSYEEFVEGIKVKLNDDNEIYYEIESGIFKRICKTASENKNQNYVLIIDEINRGNISKIFGELITLIEDSKRLNGPEEIKVKLTYSGSNIEEPLFGVPDNLYIIGTMNTADKSIALIDSALRRRFTFIEYTSDPSYLSENIEGINIRKLLEKMNNRIEYLLDRDHLLGHAYFIDVKSKNELCEVFRDKIIPLLEEYFYNDFGKIQSVFGDNQDWKKPENLHLIKVENRNRQKETFGAEIDGLEKQLFSINPDLAARNYDNISHRVFISIYEKDYKTPEIVNTENTTLETEITKTENVMVNTDEATDISDS